jgi:hypothetical protein
MSQLLDGMRDRIRTLHYSIRTEDAYVLWARRFILFHGERHPGEMGEAEVGASLTHLAVEGGVATSTQNQALSALLFLYGVVLERPLERIGEITPPGGPSGCRWSSPGRRSARSSRGSTATGGRWRASFTARGSG